MTKKTIEQMVRLIIEKGAPFFRDRKMSNITTALAEIMLENRMIENREYFQDGILVLNVKKKDSVIAYWDELYSKKPEIWGKKRNRLTSFLQDKLDEKAVLLDIGCGTGRDCHFVRSAGVRCIGTDISFRALEIAQKSKNENAHASVQFIQADGVTFLNRRFQNCFDAILSINSINHIDCKKKDTLKRLLEITRIGGYICLSIFSDEDEEWIMGRRIGKDSYSGKYGKVTLHSYLDLQPILNACTVHLFEKIHVIDEPHEGNRNKHINSMFRLILQKRG